MYQRWQREDLIWPPVPQVLAFFATLPVMPWLGTWSWRPGAFAMLVASALAWAFLYKRQRLMSDTPTSKIASAAQGYVELQGFAHPIPGEVILSRMHGLPCVWYRYAVYEKNSDGKWHLVEAAESAEPFLLRDGSGECIIEPQGVQVKVKRTETHNIGDFRYVESLLLPNDWLYVLGEFRSESGVTMNLDAKRDHGRLLEQWKQDRAHLMERFDLDGNGEIDEREWTLARSEAKRQIRKFHQEVRSLPTRHFVTAPKSRQPFVITNLDPEQLQSRYKRWATIHLALLLASFVACAVTLAR